MDNSCQGPPVIGKPAPLFSADAYYNSDFSKINLTDYKGKYVVLFFWPMDFTFVCPTEIITFAEKNAELKEKNCVLLGCSVDTKFVHMRWNMTPKKKGGLGNVDIPMLSDVTHSISRAYRCLIEDGPDAGVALRATFIIDKEGILRHMSYNDLPVGRNADEVVRLVSAFQYTDEHGEVCPAKWKKKGDKTMKPNHEDDLTKNYFAGNEDK